MVASKALYLIVEVDTIVLALNWLWMPGEGGWRLWMRWELVVLELTPTAAKYCHAKPLPYSNVSDGNRTSVR